jgi:hypothetical protein
MNFKSVIDINGKPNRDKEREFSFNLRFSESMITKYASEYSYDQSEDAVLSLISPIQSQKYITKDQLETICHWKAPRNINAKYNESTFVEEITAVSLSAKNERIRIEILTLLDGVQWPTASAILHLFHLDKYPIIDVRAIWSCGLDNVPTYSYDFWIQYVNFIRNISNRNQLDMRTIDRALWEYSNQYQGSLSS